MTNFSEWVVSGPLRTFPVGYRLDRWGVDCYICGHTFSLQSLYKEKKHGIYSPSAMIDNKRIRDLPEWNIFYRMILLKPQTGQCKISGAALYNHREIAVPLNPDQGINGADSLDRSRLASPCVHHPLDENPRFEPGTVFGYPVHLRCWDFLLVHKLGDFVDNHLPAILQALWQQYNDVGGRGNILWRQPDPGVIRPIQSLVFKAQQRRRPRLQSKRYGNRDQCLLCRSLPMEILLMVFADLEESRDFAAMQEVTGLYMGDDFWRSRIPSDVFFEVRRIGRGDDIDWAFLCVKLEQLDLDKLEGMAGRRYILGRLDKAERLVQSIISDE